MKIKHSPPKMDLSQCSRLGSLARPSGVVGFHHCLESVKEINKPGASQKQCTTVAFHLLRLFHYYLVYLFEDAVNSLLVHLASDSIFAQARSNSAEVVQRCHPERHFCLLVTELVHLDTRSRERNVTATSTTLDKCDGRL